MQLWVVGLAGQPPGPHPGRHDQRVVAEQGGVVELDAPALHADRGDAQVQRDIKVGQRTAVQGGPLLGPLPGEDLLGQRGPVVGLVRLVADQADPAGKSFGAQELNRAQPAQPSTDDHHVNHAAG